MSNANSENQNPEKHSLEPSVSTVKVSINGIEGQVPQGTTVLEAAEMIGAGMAHLCFGNALCSTCRFSPVNGADSLEEKSHVETVSLNYHFCFDEKTRLGCQTKIKGPGPVEIVVPKLFRMIAPPNKKK